jgi:hypothetical protein
MGAFEYRQAQEIRDVFQRHDIKYLFIGESGAILLATSMTLSPARPRPTARRTGNRCLACCRSAIG